MLLCLNSSKFSSQFWHEQSLAAFFVYALTQYTETLSRALSFFCSHKLLAHSLSIQHEDSGISDTTTRNSTCPGIAYLKKTSFRLPERNLQHRTCAHLQDTLKLVRTEHVVCTTFGPQVSSFYKYSSRQVHTERKNDSANAAQITKAGLYILQNNSCCS